MTAKEWIMAALHTADMTQAELSSKLGWPPQKLNRRINQNTLRADEFLQIMDMIGVNVSFSIKESGAQVRAHLRGYGRKVKQMVNGVSYDTAASDALSNSFFADGENEYTDGRAMELYISKEGRYFLAEYSTFEGAKDRIVPCSAEEAASFITKHGTVIDKRPK